jgi:bla regulator protein BlaR1
LIGEVSAMTITSPRVGEGAPTLRPRAQNLPTDDDLRQMVRQLLADRFKLSLHREMRKLPIYALVVGRNGPKVHVTDSPTPPAMNIGRGMIDAKNIRISILAQLLSSRLDHPVLDLTGLKERYDFTLRWTPEDKPGDSQGGGHDLAIPIDTEGPLIFTAVQEQLGLRLEVQKAPTVVLVIDKVEMPTEN